MARLLKTNENGEQEVIELNLGVNHFGRDPGNHFPIDHPTVSAHHCDLTLTADGVLLHDVGSTNGTFVNGTQVQQAVLETGQTLRIGDVEFFVESTETQILIPKIEREIPAPPVVLADGGMLCPRHPQLQVAYRCTHCHAVLCDDCVTVMRRKGGKSRRFCKLCSNPVESLTARPPKKQSLFAKLTATIKLPFLKSHNQD